VRLAGATLKSFGGFALQPKFYRRMRSLQAGLFQVAEIDDVCS